MISKNIDSIAREAGIDYAYSWELERFAELIAEVATAKERESCADLCCKTCANKIESRDKSIKYLEGESYWMKKSYWIKKMRIEP
jgi:hypothetical protein